MSGPFTTITVKQWQEMNVALSVAWRGLETETKMSTDPETVRRLEALLKTLGQTGVVHDG